jgi:hypothetical protein
MSCPRRNEIESYGRARELPAEWDALCADNYALKRAFLDTMERGSPSDQRYYAFRDDGGRLDSILVTYRCRKCNILMFTPLAFRMDTTLESQGFCKPPHPVTGSRGRSPSICRSRPVRGRMEDQRLPAGRQVLVNRKRVCRSLPCHSERSPGARQRLRTESRNLMHGRGVKERDPSTALRFARDDRHCPVIPSEAACPPASGRPASGSRVAPSRNLMPAPLGDNRNDPGMCGFRRPPLLCRER